MKKVFLVLPLAIVLANCSSTRNTNSTSANSGMNASTAAGAGVNADGSASGSGSMNSTSGGTSNWNSSNPGTGSASTASLNNSSSSAKSSRGNINWDVYDPNNFMQNPEKYRKPHEMTKAGGWTYNKDWRRNTNFTAEALGEWQLVLTPEVAAHWMPDTRRPEMYASFWTPEAVMARYQAHMAAIAKTQDSLAAINALANTTTKGSSSKSRRTGATASMSGATSNNGSSWGASGSGTTGTVGSGGTASVSGSGTTGEMGTGGTASASTTTNADASSTTGMSDGVTTPFVMTAVNGNNFMLPTLNMYIDNGSFTAYTGCNSAVGNVVVNGSALHFEEANPSTNVECIGGFDQAAFIERLRRADSYDVVNDQFRLKQGDQVLMIFQKNSQKL